MSSDLYICYHCESEFELKIHHSDHEEPEFCPFCGESLKESEDE